MRKITLKGDERILVVRTDRMGDVILSIPTLELIKKTYPSTHLAMLISAYPAPLLRNNPYLDELIVDDRDGVHGGLKGCFRLANFLRRRRFDISVLLHPTWRLALLLFLARVRYRVGTGYRLYSLFFNLKIFQHRKTIEKHELEYNLDMLKPLGIEPERVLPRIYACAEEEDKKRIMFEKLGIGEDDIVAVVHPGSGNSSLNLPPEKFASLADEMIEKEKVKLILTGSQAEVSLVGLVARNMKNSSINMAGKLELRELSLVLERADVVVSNSTGPMHLATAVGTPVVAIFSPILVSSPKRWGPYGEGHEVVWPQVPICRKCKPGSCRYYNCMDRIDTHQIYLKAKSILENRRLVGEKDELG